MFDDFALIRRRGLPCFPCPSTRGSALTRRWWRRFPVLFSVNAFSREARVSVRSSACVFVETSNTHLAKLPQTVKLIWHNSIRWWTEDALTIRERKKKIAHTLSAISRPVFIITTITVIIIITVCKLASFPPLTPQVKKMTRGKKQQQKNTWKQVKLCLKINRKIWIYSSGWVFFFTCSALRCGAASLFILLAPEERGSEQT